MAAKTCKCCGKLWEDGARGLDAGYRRCTHRAACITRALGPSKAKTAARKLRQYQR